MMWEKEMILEEQRRRTTTKKMWGAIEKMTYGEEGGRAAAVIFEPTDKYHGNNVRDHGGDNNDENEGETEFRENGNYNYVGG